MDKVQYQFLATPREITLINSTDETVSFGWDGEERRIPASNKIAKEHPVYSDVCHSMKDEKGRYIPGTLIVKDVLYNDPQTGEEKVVWSAANAVRHCLGIDVKSGKATSKYSDKGISVVPPNATIEEIREIAQAGRKRWAKWQVAQALGVLAAFESRNDNRKKAGLDALAASKEVLKADAIIREAQADIMEDARELAAEDTVPRVWEFKEEEAEPADAALVSDILSEPSVPKGIAETLKIMEGMKK